MQNSLKSGLIIAGIVLVGFGLFTVYATNPQIDVRPIRLTNILKSMDTESIVLLCIGFLALIGGLFVRKNK